MTRPTLLSESLRKMWIHSRYIQEGKLASIKFKFVLDSVTNDKTKKFIALSLIFLMSILMPSITFC